MALQSARPMAGLLVLDLTQGVAGPYAARLMAEHGARVIKVEPPGGDWVRQIGGGPGGVSAHYLYYNFGKEVVDLDVKSPDDLALVLRIAERADVVMQSARPGVMERLGLGFEAIRALNPSVQYLSVSGFGLTGPRAADPMTDTVAQAHTGMMSINLGMDGIPHKIGTTIIDAITGLYAFQTVAMALWPGNGPRAARNLDVSLAQAAAAAMGPKVLEFAAFGKTPASPNPPAGSYRTADGWIAVTLVRESHFEGLVRAVGRPDLAEDPRYRTFATRLDHLEPLKAELSAVLATRPTADWLAAFTAEGVLASPIHDFGDWMADAQTQATDGAAEIEVLPGVMAPVPRTPGRVPFDAPCEVQGASTARIRAEFAVPA